MVNKEVDAVRHGTRNTARRTIILAGKGAGNRPHPEEERWRSLDELRRGYLSKVEGMAELLQKLDIITEAEMHQIFHQCARLEGSEPASSRRAH